MNHILISQRLSSLFRNIYLGNLSEGAILLPDEPYYFDCSLFDAITTKKEREYVKEELMIEDNKAEMTMNAAYFFLSETKVLNPFLNFYFESGGPCTFSSAVHILDFKDGRYYFGYDCEGDDYVVLAGLTCSKRVDLILEFINRLIVSNGNEFNTEIFGSLPSYTENSREDLVPSEVVEKAYFNWLEVAHFYSQEETWGKFQEGLIERLKEPNSLKRSLKYLKNMRTTFSYIEKLQERLYNEGAFLSHEEKIGILSSYFKLSYNTNYGV